MAMFPIRGVRIQTVGSQNVYNVSIRFSDNWIIIQGEDYNGQRQTHTLLNVPLIKRFAKLDDRGIFMEYDDNPSQRMIFKDEAQRNLVITKLQEITE